VPSGPGIRGPSRCSGLLRKHNENHPSENPEFSVRPETINKRIRDIRQLLNQAGHTIQPGPHRLASLDDLYRLATAAEITVPPRSRPRVNHLQAPRLRALCQGVSVVPDHAATRGARFGRGLAVSGRTGREDIGWMLQ
jgi:hypothetical protein